MNARLALQRLWWKEIRQLLPLVTLLPALALLLYGFYLLNGGRNTNQIFRGNLLLLLGVPGLFAVGAGALLVGQEKEQRTLQWLASLPIAASSIVRVKLGAGLIGLTVLCLFSGVLFAPGTNFDAYTFSGTDWVNWQLNSLFVLLAGYALAWWSRSALVALLLVVPIAAAPHLLALLIDSVAPWRHELHDKPSDATQMVCRLACSLVALWLADRIGRRALAPESARPRMQAGFPARDRYRSDNARADYGRVQAPLPALLWQFILQSKAMLGGAASMLLVAVGLTAIDAARHAAQRSQFGWISPLVWLLGFLATCWLGVSVFQSDSVNGRIRFLADRGIPPHLVWLTRQVAPASIVALFAILVPIVLVIPAVWGWESLSASATALLFGLIGLVVIYIFTQWLGQIIPSPIVSTVAAPFVALAAIGYGTFSLHSLGAPWWLMLLLALLPLVATLTMTRRWMDRRFGVSYWFSHFGFLAAVITVPWIPLLFGIVRQPGMPAKVARQLDAVANDSPNHAADLTELVMGPASNSDGNATLLEAQWDQQLVSIERQLSLSNGNPIHASSARVLERIWAIAMLTRLTLEQDAAADGDSQATAAARRQTLTQLYSRSIKLLTQIAVRMRLSPRIIEQDIADRIEIALLQQLRNPQAVKWMGDSVYRTTAAMLANRAVREQARARAIAHSWRTFERELRQDSHLPGMFGGYNLDDDPTTPGSLRNYLLSKRRVGAAVTELWKLSQGKEQAATPERLGRIAEYWQQPPSDYGIGIAGQYLRADDLDQFAHSGFLFWNRGIASQWYADWERQASQLSGG